MITISETEPTQAYVGDTWQWNRVNLTDLYPATSWDLKYYFDSRDPAAQFTVTATADGEKFSAVLVPATTAAFLVSDRVRAQSGYYWVARAEHQTDGRIFTIGQGWLDASLSLENQAAGGFDPRNWAQKSLDALEARIQNRATIDQLGHTIADTQIQYMTPEQIQAWHGWFRAEVKSIKSGGVNKSIRVEFARGY